MLSILGVGCAHPDTVIDNRFLESLNTGLTDTPVSRELGIEQRRTLLPLEYIKQTLNQDIIAGIKASTSTPTILGTSACNIALERAGIEAQELGLVLGETATPLETTPSEAQRVGGMFGLKVDAYDAASPGSSIALQLDILNSRRKETIPEYVLCVSTSALTARVAYGKGDEGARFGDGAAAMVLSAKHPGKLMIRHTYFNADLSVAGDDGIGTFGHLYRKGDWESSVEHSVSAIVEELSKVEKLDFSKVKFIGPQISLRVLENLERRFSIPKVNHWHNVKQYGNTAGASALSVLAMNWENLRENDMIVLVMAGFGPGLGGAILSVGRI